MKRIRMLFLGAVTIGLLSAAVEGQAEAQSIIKNPGDHPPYKVELEPHGVLGWANHWAGTAFGLGFRAGIPIVQNGFIPSINNSVAISFGVDWARYSGCYYGRNVFIGYDCGASFFYFPVTMQWNFWLTTRWSVFGEPGLYVYHGVFDDICDDPRYRGGCPFGRATATSVGPAFYAGGRLHFNDTVALTIRLGYPSLSVGVSFLF